MLFFLIPASIFLVSLILMIWVVARKFVYLKKLAPETLESTDIVQKNFWAELFPELAASFKKNNLHKWKVGFLAEFEKFLRKLRLIFMRVDVITNQLIHKVRRMTYHKEEVLNPNEAERSENLVKTKEEEKKNWKEEEQELILEIAKDPKKAELYKKLGDIYIKVGEWQDALESFKKAAELDPEDIDVKIKLERVSKEVMQLTNNG